MAKNAQVVQTETTAGLSYAGYRRQKRIYSRIYKLNVPKSNIS